MPDTIDINQLRPRIADLVRQGLTYAAIARRLGMEYEVTQKIGRSLFTAAERKGIRRRVWEDRMLELGPRFSRLVRRGLPIKAIAQRFGMDYTLALRIGASLCPMAVRKTIRLGIWRRRMLKLRSEYPTYAAIAGVLKVSNQRVSQLMLKCGLERRRKGDDISKARFLTLRRHFGADRVIARRLGIDPGILARLRGKYGIPAYQPPRSYDRIKLTRKEFLRIQKAHGSDPKIAQQLGVGIARIWEFRRHNHIPAFRKWRPLSGLTITQYRKLRKKYRTETAVAAHCRVSGTALRAWKKRKKCR